MSSCIYRDFWWTSYFSERKSLIGLFNSVSPISWSLNGTCDFFGFFPSKSSSAKSFLRRVSQFSRVARDQSQFEYYMASVALPILLSKQFLSRSSKFKLTNFFRPSPSFLRILAIIYDNRAHVLNVIFRCQWQKSRNIKGESGTHSGTISARSPFGGTLETLEWHEQRMG